MGNGDHGLGRGPARRARWWRARSEATSDQLPACGSRTVIRAADLETFLERMQIRGTVGMRYPREVDYLRSHRA